MKKALAFGVTAVMLAAIAGCSKPGSGSSGGSSSDTSSATAPAAAAPPVDNSAAPAEAANPPAPTATMVKLDIKDAAGNPVSGDPESGKAVFQQCMTCHTIEPGVNKVGPSLHGIIGRHSGMIPGFNYSSANKGSGKVWTEQELYVYLKDPQKEVPGTYMTFTGVKDDQKRADVIAYLQENTK
jgi:cytochrome c